MNFLKSRETILAERLGAIKEMATKVGDVYKVKILGAEVPKSLINAFVSKAKKERDLDPRENWSDSDLAELFVKYVLDTYLNIDSIPVDSVMGEKSENTNGVQAQPTDTTLAQPPLPTQQVAPPVQEPIPTSQPIVNAEETKIASIPASLQIEKVTFTLENLDAEDLKIQAIILNTIPVERGTYKNVSEGYNDNVRTNKALVESLFNTKKETFDSLYKILLENNYIEEFTNTTEDSTKVA